MSIVFINKTSATARIPRAVICRTFNRAKKLHSNKMRGKQISVVFVNAKESKKINTKYRGQSRATNVLSFPGAEDELGDIVICPSIVRNEIKEIGTNFNARVEHLFAHGLMHLLGYDHQTSGQTNIMEKEEQRIIN